MLLLPMAFARQQTSSIQAILKHHAAPLLALKGSQYAGGPQSAALGSGGFLPGAGKQLA